MLAQLTAIDFTVLLWVLVIVFTSEMVLRKILAVKHIIHNFFYYNEITAT